jgi:polar amino acid transport system permease protein
MPERLVFRRIVLPQAVRIVIPAIGNEFISMIKDSSLVSVITVQELLWRARVTGTRDARTLPAFLIAAGVYWVLTIIFSYFQGRLERALARSDR